MEKKFKPFEKVLSRLNYSQEWQCDFYSHQDPITKYHVTVGFAEVKEDNILPYEGNEELVGTTNEPDPGIELSIDSPVMVLTDNGNWVLAEYKGFICDDEKIIVKFTNGQIVYAKVIIPLNAFYPGNNYKEYIGVKKGKLVKIYGED